MTMFVDYLMSLFTPFGTWMFGFGCGWTALVAIERVVENKTDNHKRRRDDVFPLGKPEFDAPIDETAGPMLLHIDAPECVVPICHNENTIPPIVEPFADSSGVVREAIHTGFVVVRGKKWATFKPGRIIANSPDKTQV